MDIIVFMQLFFALQKKVTDYFMHILTDTATSAYEGSHKGLRDGIQRAVRPILRESQAATVCASVQACAVADKPFSSDSPAGSLATGDTHFPSALWRDDGDPRGFRHDHSPTAPRPASHWTSGEAQLAAEGCQPQRCLPPPLSVMMPRTWRTTGQPASLSYGSLPTGPDAHKMPTRRPWSSTRGRTCGTSYHRSYFQTAQGTLPYGCILTSWPSGRLSTAGGLLASHIDTVR